MSSSHQCTTCGGIKMPLLALEETPGYTVGWGCDGCGFRSVADPELPRSRHRFHCSVCGTDLCVLCARQEARERGTPIPELPPQNQQHHLQQQQQQQQQQRNTSTPNNNNPNDTVATPQSINGSEMQMRSLHMDSIDGNLSSLMSPEPLLYNTNNNNDDNNNASSSLQHQTDKFDLGGRNKKFDDVGDSIFAPVPLSKEKEREREAFDTNLHSRLRPNEHESESGHAVWFAAAKKQWQDEKLALESPEFLDSEITTVVQESEEHGASTVPTEVSVNVTGFNKAPAGHIVFVVKVVDLFSNETWTLFKRYTAFESLAKIIKQGFKHSKSLPDLKVLPPFPKKGLTPDLDERQTMLNVWLKDVVSKATLQICDDEAVRAASTFIGLRASAYLAPREETPQEQQHHQLIVTTTTTAPRFSSNRIRVVQPSEIAKNNNNNNDNNNNKNNLDGSFEFVNSDTFDDDFNKQHSSSVDNNTNSYNSNSYNSNNNTITAITTNSNSYTSNKEAPRRTSLATTIPASYTFTSSPQPVANSYNNNNNNNNNSPTTSAVRRASSYQCAPASLHSSSPSRHKSSNPLRPPSATQSLREAKSLFSEGLISDSDFVFAKKLFIDQVVLLTESTITKLRVAKRVQDEGLISDSDYNSLKQAVLITTSDLSSSETERTSMSNFSVGSSTSLGDGRDRV